MLCGGHDTDVKSWSELQRKSAVVCFLVPGPRSHLDAQADHRSRRRRTRRGAVAFDRVRDAGSGVTGTILAQKTIGHTDYTLREITVQPGGYTGWHFHDGTLYAYVKAGTLTHNLADCSIDGVFATGRAFTEQPDQVHIGRNLGTTPLVLEVLYVLPAGSPLSEDAADPGCGF